MKLLQLLFVPYFLLKSRHFCNFRPRPHTFCTCSELFRFSSELVICLSTSNSTHFFCRLFERAIGSVGSKSSRVWDLYIEYESSEMAWYNVNSIYTRILRSHIENIDAYFARLVCWNYFCIR